MSCSAPTRSFSTPRLSSVLAHRPLSVPSRAATDGANLNRQPFWVQSKVRQVANLRANNIRFYRRESAGTRLLVVLDKVSFSYELFLFR